MVAPVRETCAQALGAVLKYMEEPAVSGVVNISLQLLAQGQWEVRHGALLSLKYILAVRQVILVLSYHPFVWLVVRACFI